MKTIDDVLLAHGGERVYHQDTNFDDVIIKHGELLRPKKVVLKKGHQHNCHRNTSGLYIMNHPDYRIATGYSLAGSVWLRHSWLRAGDTVIETTEKCRLYFGVTFDEIQAARFVIGNLYDITPLLSASCREQSIQARSGVGVADQERPLGRGLGDHQLLEGSTDT